MTTLVHEWLRVVAGSESVLTELALMVPDAQIVVGRAIPEIARAVCGDREVRALLNGPPLDTDSAEAGLLITAFMRARLEDGPLVISSHFASHLCQLRSRQTSLVYYHTPMRILWGPREERSRISGPSRAAMTLGSGLLRAVDRKAGSRSQLAIANSLEIRDRLHAAYGIDAHVISPPVKTDRFRVSKRAPEDFLLWVGRDVPYKRLDLAIEAAALAGIPLKVVGAPGKRKLPVSGDVEILGFLSEDEIAELMARAVALIHPGREDFGITAAEAIGAGLPVIAYDHGGVVDYITDGLNGVLVHQQTPAAFAKAIVERRTELRAMRSDDVMASVQHLSSNAFRAAMAPMLKEVGVEL